MKSFCCGVSPQQVRAGKPNCGAEYPGGVGAGVVCKVASFFARDSPEVLELRAERSMNSVTRKDCEGVSLREPWPWDRGHSVGTTAWRALRDACSPGKSMCARLEVEGMSTCEHDFCFFAVACFHEELLFASIFERGCNLGR